MNVNYGLFPEIAERFRGRDKKRQKRRALADRAFAALDGWLGVSREAAE